MSLVHTPNGVPLPRAAVPRLPVEALQQAVRAGVADGARVAAYFGADAELWAVLVCPDQGTLALGRAPLGPMEALTPDCPALHLFERALVEEHGVTLQGHPWLKPVRFPRGGVGEMDFLRMDGGETHEVAVGPVHAGVIEPGHFRFQCHGEQVLHLEISLGYQHRGVSRALRGGPDKRSLHLIETLAGDTSVAHATAYAMTLEGLAGVEAPARAQALRGVALELERLANHTGDLGALAGDVGYQPTAAFCGRLRGDWLNLTARLCGNRFGRSLVRPGGLNFTVDEALAGAMDATVERSLGELRPAIQLLWDSAGVMSRFEDTGVVSPETARSIGLVGVAARASDLDLDARVDLPAGIWRYEQLPLSTWTSGDVFARARVRALEIERSAAFVRERLRGLPPGPGLASVGALAADRVCVSVVEGWRGELAHVALTDGAGRFQAYEVVDPSFHNWTGLALALRGQQISDFPLCNKSFNLSYCGFDL